MAARSRSRSDGAGLLTAVPCFFLFLSRVGIHWQRAGWAPVGVAPRTCRTEAQTLLGVWHSQAQGSLPGADLQIARHAVWAFFPPDEVPGWGWGESGAGRAGEEGLGSNVSKANPALWAFGGGR